MIKNYFKTTFYIRTKYILHILHIIFFMDVLLQN